MNTANMPTRRETLKMVARGSGAAIGLPLIANADAAEKSSRPRRLKIVVVGGHPDDTESGCGGIMARYADLEHEVVALYLTRGEAGISGKTAREAAAIRTAECEAACKILKARPVFAGQIDGKTEVTAPRYDEFRKIVESEKPDVVFTHWPIDTHRDHRAASFLVYDAWLRMGKKFALYYFEVMSGSQTQHFQPTDYVDITTTEERKRAACFAHESQHPAGFYAHHEHMNRFRGLECACKYAEAFVRHVQSSKSTLP